MITIRFPINHWLIIKLICHLHMSAAGIPLRYLVDIMTTSTISANTKDHLKPIIKLSSSRNLETEKSEKYFWRLARLPTFPARLSHRLSSLIACQQSYFRFDNIESTPFLIISLLAHFCRRAALTWVIYIICWYLLLIWAEYKYSRFHFIAFNNRLPRIPVLTVFLSRTWGSRTEDLKIYKLLIWHLLYIMSHAPNVLNLHSLLNTKNSSPRLRILMKL